MPMVSPQLLPSTRFGTGQPIWDPFARGSSDNGAGPSDATGSANASGPSSFSEKGLTPAAVPFYPSSSPTTASAGVPTPLTSLSGTAVTSPNALRAIDGEEDILPPLIASKGRAASLGALASSFRPFAPASAGAASGDPAGGRATATLFIQNLPRDITRRELHLMFTFASDYVSCEITKQGVAEDGLPALITATARFRSVLSAAAAQSLLEHRPDVFGDVLYSQSAQPPWPLKCEVRSGALSTAPASASGSSTNLSGAAAGARNPKSRFVFMSGEDAPAANSSGAATSAPGTSPGTSSGVATRPATAGSGPNSAGLPSSADRMFSPSSPRGGIFAPPPRSIFGGGEEYIQPLASSISGLHINTMDRRNSQGNLYDDKNSPPLAQSALAPGAGGAGASSGSSGSSTAPSGAPQERPLAHRRGSMPAPRLGQLPVEGALDGSKVIVPYTPATSAKAMSIMQSGGRVMPPANPADQNPPCNTLYVGNLPPDTSEEELKSLFSARPGYKRLCFRTKANGPMCFVEFDDEAFAGQALEELYGFGLSNSVKGGIRLSFSKNPLGVRSNRPGPPKPHGQQY